MPVYHSSYPRPPQARVVDYRSELLAAVDDLPPLPLVLNRVMQLLNDTSSSSAQIAAMVEKDTVLSGSVLRCVNSAYYGLSSTVTSIRHAVSMLGFGTVRNLALAFSLRRMIAGSRVPPPRLYARYSQHSLSTAILCADLAGYLEVDDAEAAFASGLFHDIGRLLILATFPELMQQIHEQYETTERSYEELERAALTLSHPEVSKLVMQKWQLPECIQNAVEFHHRPAEAPHAPERPFTLAEVVQAADLYVNEYGLDLLPSKRPTPVSADRAFEALGLRQKMPEVLEKFRHQYEGIRTLF